MPDAFLLTVCGLFGLARRLLPQRRHLAGPPARVDRAAGLALSELWHRARRDRERPGALLAGPARPLPALRRPDLGALPARGAPRPPASGSGLALRFGAAWELPPYLVLAAGLVALSLIDLDHFLLPNRVLYPTGFMMAALFVIPAVVDGQGDDYLRGVLGGAAAFAVFFVIHVISPRGMGFGDVRLSFVLGFALGWLSWGHVYLGLFLGFLLGAVIGLAARSRCGCGPARTTSRSVRSSPRVRCSPSTRHAAARRRSRADARPARPLGRAERERVGTLPSCSPPLRSGSRRGSSDRLARVARVVAATRASRGFS